MTGENAPQQSCFPEPAPPLPFDRIVASLRAAGSVFAEDEARLLCAAGRTSGQLDSMVGRRIAGVPLEHVLGWAEFCGLRVAVDAGVFVPRRRTEFLVRHAIALARPPSVLVDLCCGSGAVAAAVGAAAQPIELYAVDIEPSAVRCARRNVAGIGGRVYQGDLYQALPASLSGRVDVLVANAPYVPTDAIRLMPPEARLHEPRVALDGGVDGLDVLRRVLTAAPQWLAPRGRVLVETSELQAPELVDVGTRSGLTARVEKSEELDACIVVGAVPPSDDPQA